MAISTRQEARNNRMAECPTVRPLVYYPATVDYYRPSWAEGVLDAVDAISFEDHAEMFTSEAFYASVKAEENRN